MQISTALGRVVGETKVVLRVMFFSTVPGVRNQNCLVDAR